MTQPPPQQPQQPYAPAPYGQPQQYPYGYPPAPQPRAQDKTWMNITAFVTALCGISIAGIVFGHLGLGAAKRGEADQRGLGLAGLIIGYVQLGIVLALVAFYVLFFVVFVGAWVTSGVPVDA